MSISSLHCALIYIKKRVTKVLQMEKALNKSLSILLSLAMIIGLFAAAPISANAEITVTYLDAEERRSCSACK